MTLEEDDNLEEGNSDGLNAFTDADEVILSGVLEVVVVLLRSIVSLSGTQSTVSKPKKEKQEE